MREWIERIKHMKRETVLKIQIVGGLSLFFNSSIYMHADILNHSNGLHIICYLILVTISLYFIVDGCLHFFEKKLEENQEKYNTILKVEKAFYLMLKQKWNKPDQK